MQPKVNYTVVGAFVIALIAATTLSIIWLSAGLNRTQYTVYEVYMKESVTGLAQEATVKYNGVNVGYVKNIRINRQNPQLVELLLNIKTDTPITLGTRATLDTQGLTGVMYIALQDKGDNLTPLQVEPGAEHPVIKTSPSLFLRIDATLSNLTNTLNQVGLSIQAIFDTQNQKQIKQAFANINQLTQSMAATSKQLNMLMPAANQALNNLNNTSNNFLILSDELRQNPSLLVRGKASQKLGPGEK